MKVLNSLIVPKNVNGGPLGFFNIHSVSKYQKVDPLETMKNFRKKILTKPKKEESLRVPKNGMVLYFMLEVLDAFNFKYLVFMVKQI